MKIEHTTYDQTRTQPTHSRHHPRMCQPRADEKRPLTLWPAEAVTTEPQPGMTTFLMLERRREKEAQKLRSNPENHDVEPRPRRNSVPTRTRSAATPHNQLRRKPNFAKSWKECLRSPKFVAQKQAEEHDPMPKIYTVRDAIRAGKLEVAIPPLVTSKFDRGAAPPTRLQIPIAKPVSPIAARCKKTPAHPNKFGEFIDRSADMLDETRKGLISKFEPPFEHLNYPSFTHSSQKPRRTSATSDMSFCCIGEQETEPTQEIQALKARQLKNLERRSYKGDPGTDPWVHPPPGVCRLCRKPGIRGIRGLCHDCENDFIRPKTQKFEFVDSDDDEVKPPPPLKDLKALTTKKTQDLGVKRKPVSHSNSDNLERRQPQGSVKAEQKMTSIDNYQPVINSIRQNSQRDINERGDDVERFSSRQTPATKDEYEKAKSLFKSWSDCYETEDHERWNLETDGESASLANRDEQRESEFYRFYDDLLGDHKFKASPGRKD